MSMFALFLGKKIGLSEFQAVMYRRNTGAKNTQSPGVLWFSKKSARESIPHSNVYVHIHVTAVRYQFCIPFIRAFHRSSDVSLCLFSRTFVFLCELQKFLNEVSPQGNPLLAQDEVERVSPSVLHSLPPLTLGVSSSESLLLELVNSSGPTVFYFPHQSLRLRSHRVELALKPSLLSVLKLKLDEALAQVRMEEIGRGAMDKLQILGVLSVLPEDGAEPETGDQFTVCK